MKNLTVKMLMALTTVGILSGGSLSLVYQIAAPAIEKHRLENLQRSIFLVLPGAVRYREKNQGKKSLYEGMDSGGKSVGYAVECSGNGFQGKIALMIGVTRTFDKLKGIAILSQIETPGLGNKISGKNFQKQFQGLSTQPKIEYVKNRRPSKPNQIQAITAATISSRSVVKIINRSLDEYRKAFKG